MPNVTFFFNHKLTGADFRKCRAWFEVQGKGDATTAIGRAKEIEVAFDFMIGADGAHSAVRYHLMKYVRMDYHQEYIDTLWCEFQIQPNEDAPSDQPMSRFRISPNHLHIWPGKEFMFIAIPSDVSVSVFTRVVSRIPKSLLLIWHDPRRMVLSPARCLRLVWFSKDLRLPLRNYLRSSITTSQASLPLSTGLS